MITYSRCSQLNSIYLKAYVIYAAQKLLLNKPTKIQVNKALLTTLGKDKAIPVTGREGP
jgi:hypothetical protein